MMARRPKYLPNLFLNGASRAKDFHARDNRNEHPQFARGIRGWLRLVSAKPKRYFSERLKPLA